MKLYLTVFLVMSIGAGLLAKSLTIHPMPWWPDTVIMGLPFGIMGALGAWQHRRTNRLIWNALKRLLTYRP